MGPYYQAFPEGGSIKLYADDAKRNHEEISKWSKKDADAMPRGTPGWAGLADVLGPLLLTVPPKIGSRKPHDLVETLRLAWRHRGLDVRTIGDVTRLMAMSIADLLDDWFESPQVKGAMAVNGVIGTWAGPYEPGTAYVMAHHSIGDIGDGHLGNWGFPEGGMGGVSAAIEAAARELRRRDPDQRQGRPAHRRGRPGQRRRAGQRRGAAGQGRRLDPAPAHRVPRPRRRGAPARRLRPRHRALEDPQRRRQDQPGPRPSCRTSPPTPAPNCRSTTPARSRWRRRWSTWSGRSRTPATGKAAARPFSDGVIPSTFDKTLCPEGTHIMSLFTQWVPSDWSEEPHTEELEAYADRMIDCYNELAPNFKGSILHRDVVGPYEMEHEYGLIGGNIFHGELSLEQLFHMRPAPGYADYRTPIKGLYNASSATHAGGGVCGIPGWQAAKAAIKDRKASPPGRPASARSPGGHDRPASRWPCSAMLEPRSIAVVGASARPGSFGERMADRGGQEPGRAAHPPRQSPVRRDRRAALLPVPRRHPRARSTWCCSASATPRWRRS